MCSFTKKHQLLVDFVPQTVYRGSAPGRHWGTSVPQTLSLLLCPPNNPLRLTPLVKGAHAEFSLDQFCVQMITTATFITCSS